MVTVLVTCLYLERKQIIKSIKKHEKVVGFIYVKVHVRVYMKFPDTVLLGGKRFVLYRKG